MAAQTFRHTHRVTFAECTVGNHVYYARYLDVLEAARGELLRQSGAPLLQWQERDAIFPVVECRLRYKAPASYDDVLTVEVWLTAAERVRLNFAYRLFTQTGKAILEAETLHVCTSTEGKPRRLPDELVSQLKPYLHAQHLI